MQQQTQSQQKNSRNNITDIRYIQPSRNQILNYNTVSGHQMNPVILGPEKEISTTKRKPSPQLKKSNRGTSVESRMPTVSLSNS